jgi:F0F1-type ATP synthase assembly protein I
VDVSQRREISEQVHHTTGSFELVLSPLLLALIGFGLDRWIGTTPLLTIVFAVAGLTGACIKMYCTYQYEMQQHEAAGLWNRHKQKTASGNDLHSELGGAS